MDAAYLQAAVPKPFTILGKRLQPFCLGHDLLFQRFNVGFSPSIPAAPSYDDLIFSTLVCSRPATDAMKFFESRNAWLKIKLWGWRCGAFDAVGKVQLFQEYINDHAQLPDIIVIERNSGDFSDTGTPTIQAVKVSLMANLGMSESEALNTPYALAFWNHYAWAEARGAIQIVDDKERERQESAKVYLVKIEEMRRKVQERMNSQRGGGAPCLA